MLLHKELTDRIIGCFYEVHNELGGGFLESVYEQALMLVFKEKGIQAINNVPLNVKFKGILIGEFRADLLVENKVLIELKAVNLLNKQHEAQLINYLKATGIKVGLLVNFGDKLEFRRRIF